MASPASTPTYVDVKLKILLVGESGVGKSSILQRFCSDTFTEVQPPTIGVDFTSRIIDVSGRKIKLTIWDTAGQEKFRALTSTFYRGAKGVVLVYDVTRGDTLDALRDHWMSELAAHVTPEPVKMVVANKIDMNTQRQVTWEAGMQLARDSGSLFVETSAKSGVAVGTAFEELVLKILESPALLAGAADGQGGKQGEGGLALGQMEPVPPNAYCAC